MKKILNFCVFCAMCIAANAQSVEVSDFQIKPGEKASFTVSIDPKGVEYTGIEFDIQFPNSSLSTTKTKTLNPSIVDFTFVVGGVGAVGIENLARCGGASTANPPIPFADGLNEFCSIEVLADANLDINKYDIVLTNITLIAGETRTPLDDVSFQADVVNMYTIVLDETSTTAPAASDGAVNAQVKRTIKANEWSTICLPFEMTEDQVKTAFGNDVQLAEFTAWESSENDETGEIDAITVGFTSVNAIAANTPLIIKTSKAISEFTVDNVEIDPEDEPSVQVGKKKAEKGFFNGTYIAETLIPEDNLFLSKNKFYYSAGNTKIKAFRGYFEFYDALDVKEISAGAKMAYVIDGTTLINGINADYTNEAIYDLSGRRIQKAQQRGVYIVNGKKVAK